MTVQAVVPTVTVPRQAGPVDPPLAPLPLSAEVPAVRAAPLLGRDRPLTPDERQFAIGLVAVFVALMTYIVSGLLLAQYVWS